MTPLAPGGQNGGAGLVATSLVRELSRIAPDQHLLLLTHQDSHAELAALDAPNVQRLCVRASPRSSTARELARKVLGALPPRVRARIRNASSGARHRRRAAHLLEQVKVNLLFSPFTEATFARDGIPLVAIVHDLQHLDCPEFFSIDQRLARQHQLTQLCARAERIVCVSSFVRQSVLHHLRIPAERVVAIPHGLLHDVSATTALALSSDASDPPFPSARPPMPDGTTGVPGDSTRYFLLYPANFWPHKNHRVLFEALGLFRATRSELDVRLVCTGAPGPLQESVRRAALETLGPDVVDFPGYVSSEELRWLMRDARALIFPSLYEGFGMPVLEAMAAGTPVLCSNVTSLPEVAGDAARYFDPRDPRDIERALEWRFGAPNEVREQVARGRVRAAQFGDAHDLACRYQALFDEVLV